MIVAHPEPEFEAVLTADGFAPSAQREGAVMPQIASDQLDKLRGNRATAQKIDGWVLCAAPMPSGARLVHGYRGLPKGAALSDLIRNVEKAALALTGLETDPQPDETGKLRQAALAVSSLPVKERLGHLLYAVRDAGFVGIQVLAVIKNGRVRKMHSTNKAAVNVHDELRAVIGDHNAEGAQLDLDLIAGSLGGTSGRLFMPDDPANGLAFFGVDLTPASNAAMANQHDFFALLTELNPKRGGARRAAWGAAGLAILTAVGIYLAMPAPVYVSNFARAQASQSITVALPFGAFLEQSLVRPGQMLEEGEVAAVLRSPEIENGIAEQKVSYSLEQINAQDALNAGNYGEFQLAEKRAEIALLRQQQFESRQAQLTVTSPVASRVVTALPDGDRGDFLAAGSPVVTLQPTSTFDLMIDVAPQDSALVQPGQTGHVFFRGLSDETFDLEVLSTATQIVDPDTGEMRMMTRARLKSSDQTGLLVGMSGFAKIETRTAPRIVGLTRPLMNYVRLTLWKTLGFTF